MFSFSLLAPPSVEPVTLAEAKAYARIDTDNDDALVATLITGARQWAERMTGRAFITQTWKLSIDISEKDWWDGDEPNAFARLFAANAISLPRAPLQRVTSVQYFNDDDAAVTWAAANYFVDTSREPGRLVRRTNAVWPSPTRLTNSMIVTYVAGYGDDATSVPGPIKIAVRDLVAGWYQNRGDEAPQPTAAAQALLDPYRLRFSGV